MCEHTIGNICLPCFVNTHLFQIVKKDYCILLKVGTGNYYTHLADRVVSPFTPCLALLQQAYDLRYSGNYKNKLLTIPFDKEYTTYNKDIWPGIKRKARELLKDPEIQNQFLASRLKGNK